VSVAYEPEFVDEVDEAYFSLLVRDPVAAQRFRRQLDRAIEGLANRQLAGREVEIFTGELVRRWWMAPYVLYYRETPTGITMVRLRHQARRSIER
jgi:plasmid stabilization system protein ParE